MTMDANDFLLLILLMTAGTVITRCFFFIIGSSRRLPGWIQKSLGYVPPVALAAILAPDLLMAQGVWVEPWQNLRLMAAVAATAFFLLTRHVLGTLVCGMICYTALRLWTFA
jgi:branched-subunit amino acid transport protein